MPSFLGCVESKGAPCREVNVQLPTSLAGSGAVALQLTAADISANTVQVAIQ